MNIRERFEIAARPGFPPGSPGMPYRAVTNRKAALLPRYVGEFSEEEARYMLTLIERSISYVRDTSTQHTHGGITHHHGQDDHIAHFKKPYHEAHAAVHQRAQRLGFSL